MILGIIDIITNIIEELGYIGIFIPMVFDTCFIPLMSQATVPFAGFLVSEGVFNLHLVALVAAFGNTFGAFLMYMLGTKINESKLTGLIKRYGKYILLDVEDYFKAKDFLNKGSKFKIIIGRLLPAVRNVMSLPAGVAHINMQVFLLFSFIGSLIWSYILVISGFVLGENWEKIRGYISKFEIFVFAGFFILLGLYIWHKLGAKKAVSNH